MTLKEALCGDVVVIKAFSSEEDILKKVCAMGLRKGSQFEVLCRCGRNLLLRNGTNCLIISEELADKIEVELKKRVDSSCEELKCTLKSPPCPSEEAFPQRGLKKYSVWLKKFLLSLRKK